MFMGGIRKERRRQGGGGWRIGMGRRRLDVKHLDSSQQDVNAVAKPASDRIQLLFQSIIVDFLLGETCEVEQRIGRGKKGSRRRVDGKHLDLSQQLRLLSTLSRSTFSPHDVSRHQNMNSVWINLDNK